MHANSALPPFPPARSGVGPSDPRTRSGTMVPPTGWTPDTPEQILVDALVAAARSVDRDATLGSLYDALRRHDPALCAHVGGDILAYLEGRAEEPCETLFDKRYGLLLRIAARFDAADALSLHERAADLYRRFGKSLIRYGRIGATTRNGMRQIRSFAEKGLETPPVATVPDTAFEHVVRPLGTCPSALLAAASSRNALLRVELPEPRLRRRLPLSVLDDSGEAVSRWLDQPEETPVEALTFYALNDVRISARPSCITFGGADGERRCIGAMSDMYHHSATLGRVGLGTVRRRVSLAYLLPRFGPPDNHYHSIVDKAASLAGYRALGLHCPIVAAVAPNAAERLLIEALGIDSDLIVVDADASVLVERGIVARQIPLRPLLYELCATLSGAPSPFGPDIYIARGEGGGRVLVNEAEVEDALRGRGFDIVRMEEHDVSVQFAIAANARRIVGPHGAGLANAVFAARGSDLLELIPAAYMNSCFARLALDCGHRYGVLIGPSVGGGGSTAQQTVRFRIDIDRLVRVLDDVDGRVFPMAA